MTDAAGAPRRFRDALDRARVAWGEADPQRQAERAGCEASPAGIVVPFFGRAHLVSHPQGEVTTAGKPAHAAVAILLLHYLERADGTPLTGDWRTFRELPDGLFYWPSFTARTEAPLALAFGGSGEADGLAAFRVAAALLGGRQLALADVGFAFAALPRLGVAALLWEGDEGFPAAVRIVFDAAASHYLPAEDLEGVAETLTRMLLARHRA
jgi:hypothetical protein